MEVPRYRRNNLDAYYSYNDPLCNKFVRELEGTKGADDSVKEERQNGLIGILYATEIVKNIKEGNENV